MQASARAAGIDDEARLQAKGIFAAVSFEHGVPAIRTQTRHVDFVAIIHASRNRLLYQEMIEVRTIPVGVRDRVVRAGGNQQLTFVLVRVAEGGVEVVTEKAEPSFESAGHRRAVPLPGPPLRER